MPYRLATPQCLVIKVVCLKRWLGWKDLNPRMLESESNALPLGDTPLYWASLTPMHVYIAPATLWKLRPQNEHGAFGGTRTPDPRLRRAMLYPAELQTHAFIGAGDGNRTHTASLEGWNSTIELHPRFSARQILEKHTTRRTKCQ